MKPYIGTTVSSIDDVRWDIQLNNCGFYKELPNDIPAYRPNGRIDHHLIFVERGSLAAEIEGRTVTAYKDEIVYFPPNVSQRYCYAAGADSLYYWLHFSGTKIGEFLSVFPFSHGIYRLKRLPEYTGIIQDIIQKYDRRELGAAFYCHSQTQLLLTRMGQEIFAESGVSRNAARAEKIAAQLRSSPGRELSNRLLAERYGISQYHLIRTFKEETGCAPQKYRNLMRVERAKQLLTDTELNINEISDMLGFADSLYFSRLFKRIVGVSPRDYRTEGNSR